MKASLAGEPPGSAIIYQETEPEQIFIQVTNCALRCPKVVKSDPAYLRHHGGLNTLQEGLTVGANSKMRQFQENGIQVHMST